LDRALGLATTKSDARILTRLRAERINQHGLSGTTARLPDGELEWANAIAHNCDESYEFWPEVTRASLCATLGDSIATKQRKKLSDRLFAATTDGRDLDLRSDALALALRSAIEIVDFDRIRSVLAYGDELASSARPVDRWGRNAIRSCVASMTGNLTSALRFAYDAYVIGASFGVSDSLLTWTVQSRLIGSVSERPIDFDKNFPIIRTQDDSEAADVGPNATALGAAFFANDALLKADEKTANLLLEASVSAIDVESHDFFLLPAAAWISQTCFGLRREVPECALNALVPLGNASVVVGMTPAASLGPASRFVAQINYLNGDLAASEESFRQTTTFCRETGQLTWEAATLRDWLRTVSDGERADTLRERLRVVLSRFS
jgi:hypothetical protein